MLAISPKDNDDVPGGRVLKIKGSSRQDVPKLGNQLGGSIMCFGADFEEND